MAEDLNIKTWNNSSSFTSNFKMTSKYTDLGKPDSKKSILGVMLNLSVKEESTTASHNTYNVVVKYRTSVTGDYNILGIFRNIYSPTNSNKGNQEIIEILPVPIKNILNIQLQIRGHSIRGDFGINDFGLIFREYRTGSNIVTLDEE